MLLEYNLSFLQTHRQLSWRFSPRVPDQKPTRPCIFWGKDQCQLKRHILSEHKDLPSVSPILSMTAKNKTGTLITSGRKHNINNIHNIKVVNDGNRSILRARHVF